MDRRGNIRHFLIVLSGNGAAQAANLLSYPFLSRIYSPREFGVFAMFLAASAIPGAVACGRFDLAVPTAPRWGRVGVLWLCVLIGGASGLLSVLGSLIYFQLRGVAAPWALSLMFGLTVALIGVSQAETSFLMRHDRYRDASSSLPLRTGSAVAVQIGLGLISATALSLIIGFVVGLVAQVALLSFLIWRRIAPKGPAVRDMRAMFLRYRRQVTVDIPSTVLAALSLNLLTFLLGARFGQRSVGFYSIGQRLAIVPLQLVNEAVGQTYFQKAAKAHETKGHFWDEMKFSLLTSGLFSLLSLVAILLFARPFIVIFLGQQWAPAADMLMVLAPMLAIRSLTLSIITTVFVMRSAHWLFIHNLSVVAVTMAAYALATIGNVSAVTFLTIAALFLGIEYAGFAMFLIYRARRQRTRSLSGDPRAHIASGPSID